MNQHASDGAVTTTVSTLSDDRLLERTKELSRIEHHLEVVVIDHLREIQKRRLYLRRGFSSLFDYAVRELGYSDAAAWRRIKAMRLCADVEGVRERLQNGSRHLLQIDHVVPYACGGAAEPNNLRLLCAAHHRYRHLGAGFGRPGEDRQAPVDR